MMDTTIIERKVRQWAFENEWGFTNGDDPLDPLDPEYIFHFCIFQKRVINLQKMQELLHTQDPPSSIAFWQHVKSKEKDLTYYVIGLPNNKYELLRTIHIFQKHGHSFCAEFNPEVSPPIQTETIEELMYQITQKCKQYFPSYFDVLAQRLQSITIDEQLSSLYNRIRTLETHVEN